MNRNQSINGKKNDSSLECNLGRKHKLPKYKQKMIELKLENKHKRKPRSSWKKTKKEYRVRPNLL